MSAEDVKFHIVGDAYVDFFCFLGGDWPEHGGDSRLNHPVKTYAGGSSTNTATHLNSLAKAGAKGDDQPAEVVLHTVLNPDDHYGDILVKHASNHQFPIINCRKETDTTSTTGHCIAIVSGGERSFMTHQGCMDTFCADDVHIDKIIDTKSNIHIHFAGFYNMPGFWHGKLHKILETIREQRNSGFSEYTTTISLVTQHDATKAWDGGLDDILPLLDFAIMNDLEADNIVARVQQTHKIDNPNKETYWATHFGRLSPSTNFIVTQGKDGAVALRGGKVMSKQLSRGVDPVDPTGAGDSFTAGFLYGLWTWKTATDEAKSVQDDSKSSSTWPTEAIQDGLQWGCAVGGAAVMIRGASIPATSEQIEEFRTI